jgi:hypothetical protein
VDAFALTLGRASVAQPKRKNQSLGRHIMFTKEQRQGWRKVYICENMVSPNLRNTRRVSPPVALFKIIDQKRF